MGNKLLLISEFFPFSNNNSFSSKKNSIPFLSQCLRWMKDKKKWDEYKRIIVRDAQFLVQVKNEHELCIVSMLRDKSQWLNVNVSVKRISNFLNSCDVMCKSAEKEPLTNWFCTNIICVSVSVLHSKGFGQISPLTQLTFPSNLLWCELETKTHRTHVYGHWLNVIYMIFMLSYVFEYMWIYSVRRFYGF